MQISCLCLFPGCKSVLFLSLTSCVCTSPLPSGQDHVSLILLVHMGFLCPVSVGNTFQQPLASLKRFIQVEPFFCSYSLGNFCIDQFLSAVAIILCIKRHFVFLSLLDILLALQFKTFFSVDITMFSPLYFKFTLVTHIQKIITEVTGLNIYNETQ